jgi:uncharacterized NAD-dependent epimerase/dehydratase family protein
MNRRYLILASHAFTSRSAKMAHGVIAYSSDEVVAVVDPDLAGRRVGEIFPHLRRDAPIVASIEEGLRFGPTSLLVGIAPAGGALPGEFRDAIRTALRARLEVVSGLHEMLADDQELAALARTHDSRIWDLRLPPPAPLFSGAAWDVRAKIVLTVGSDAAVGKMTAALELTRAARARGGDAAFVPTGQIGIAIAGWGTAIDRVVADFAPGAAEQLVLEGERRARDLLFLEGQGGISNPAFAPVTLALLFGGAPDALVLVHSIARRTIESYDLPILGYRRLIDLYESLCATVKPARVVGIALNTRECDDEEARREIARAHEETGLPCDDVVRNGPEALYAAIAPALVKTEVLHA